HGIGFLKGCVSPTALGAKTACTFTVRNNVDTGPDTLTVTSIVDVVKAAGGDDNAGNILPSLSFTFTGGSYCNGGQTLCTLPPGSSMTSAPFLYHTVTTADVTSANPLVDQATLTWQDTCNSGAANCPIGDQTSTTSSQTTLQAPSACPNVVKTAKANGDGTTTFVFDQGTFTNDNSYGVNAIGWGGAGKHTFGNLTGSDRAKFAIYKPDGVTPVLDFNLDYISAGARKKYVGSVLTQMPATSSLYDSLGPFGGDGSFTTGNPQWLVDWSSTLVENLNNPGVYSAGVLQAPYSTPGPFFVNPLVNSPKTLGPLDPAGDSSYTIDPASPWVGTNATSGKPKWNFNDAYSVKISNAAFPDPDGAGPLGPGFAAGGYLAGVSFVHNSPAKVCPLKNGFQMNAGYPNGTQWTLSGATLSIPLANRGTAATLSKATISWPAVNNAFGKSNGNLLSIKLGSATIYSTSTGVSPTTITSWASASRTINSGSTVLLTLTFAKSPALVGPYGIDLEFGVGNLLTVDIPDMVPI
ncbi:MAG: hypothetical protein ACKOOG_02510, partial [Actinomycetota bacterium]